MGRHPPAMGSRSPRRSGRTIIREPLRWRAAWRGRGRASPPPAHPGRYAAASSRISSSVNLASHHRCIAGVGRTRGRLGFSWAGLMQSI